MLSIGGVLDKVFKTDITSNIKNMQSDLYKWANDNVEGPKIEIPKMSEKPFFEIIDPMEAFWKTHNKTAEIVNNVKGSLDLSMTNDYLKTIAGNTGKTNSTLDLTKEELKYLRDVAEQEVINRYTTASINNNNTFNNNINSETDVDGVVSKFYNGLAEAASMVAEGV